MTGPSPDRLVAALTAAGWVEFGDRAHDRARLRYASLSPHVVVPLDPSAPEYRAVFEAALATLRQLVELGDTAERALGEATCPCGGRRWVDDENWQPERWELERGREPASGLIPCGFCNEGGWDTPAHAPR